MDFSGKTIVVTGASGLIGSNLVNRLLENYNCNVIAIGRNKGKLEKAFENYQGRKNLRLIQHDVSDPLTLDENVDFIFHAAGPMEGKIIREYPMSVINPNILGVINCLEFLRIQKKKKNYAGRLVVFSSVTVYGNNTAEDITVAEEDTCATESLDSISAPYSQSKRLIEVITRAYCRQFDIDAVIGRFATVYGYTKVVPDTAFFEFIQKGIKGENILLNSSNLPRRDNIYVDDAINGILLVAQKGEVGEAYNISSNGDLGNYASVDEIANAVAYHSGHSKVMYKNEYSNLRKPGLKLDNKKLKGLGWDVKVSLYDGIAKVMDAYKVDKR